MDGWSEIAPLPENGLKNRDTGHRRRLESFLRRSWMSVPLSRFTSQVGGSSAFYVILSLILLVGCVHSPTSNPQFEPVFSLATPDLINKHLTNGATPKSVGKMC